MDENEKQNSTSEGIKNAEKVYKKLLPNWNRKNGTSIVKKMAESAVMAKCLSDTMLPSSGIKFSRGYSKAADQIQRASDLPKNSIWKTEWEPGDEPTAFDIDHHHTSQARTIDFTGSIQNLQNQHIPSYDSSKNGDAENIKDAENINFDQACPIELPETNSSVAKGRSNRDIKMDSSGKPILGPNHRRMLKLHKISEPKSFDINLIMQGELGVHSLTDYTYKEQQLVKKAVNRCKYKDQSLEWYNSVDINTVRVESHFEAVGADADVYNDDEEASDSTGRPQGSKWYNDESINAVCVETFFGTGEFKPEEEERGAFIKLQLAVNKFVQASKLNTFFFWTKSGFSVRTALNNLKRRWPLENRVQIPRSSLANQHRFNPKLRRLGGVTERFKLKKYNENQKCKQCCQKCKQRCQFNNNLRKARTIKEQFNNNLIKARTIKELQLDSNIIQLLKLYEKIDTDAVRIEPCFNAIGNDVGENISVTGTTILSSSDFFFSFLILTHKLLIQDSGGGTSKIGVTKPSSETKGRARNSDRRSTASVVKMLSISQKSLGAGSRARDDDQRPRAFNPQELLSIIKFPVVKFEVVNDDLTAFVSNTVYNDDTFPSTTDTNFPDASNSVKCIKTDHSFSFNPQDLTERSKAYYLMEQHLTERSKAYHLMEQQSKKSEENISQKKKMNIEMIYLSGFFLSTGNVNSTTKNTIESSTSGYLSGIFLPSPHCKLAMMAKCISISHLTSMNRKLMIDLTSCAHNLQRRELSTCNKNNNGNYRFIEVTKTHSWMVSTSAVNSGSDNMDTSKDVAKNGANNAATSLSAFANKDVVHRSNHDCDKDPLKLIPSEMVPVPTSNSGSIIVNIFYDVVTLNVFSVYVPVKVCRDAVEFSSASHYYFDVSGADSGNYKNLRNICDCWWHFSYIPTEMGGGTSAYIGGSSAYIHNFKTFSLNGTSSHDRSPSILLPHRCPNCMDRLLSLPHRWRNCYGTLKTYSSNETSSLYEISSQEIIHLSHRCQNCYGTSCISLPHRCQNSYGTNFFGIKSYLRREGGYKISIYIVEIIFKDPSLEILRVPETVRASKFEDPNSGPEPLNVDASDGISSPVAVTHHYLHASVLIGASKLTKLNFSLKLSIFALNSGSDTLGVDIANSVADSLTASTVEEVDTNVADSLTAFTVEEVDTTDAASLTASAVGEVDSNIAASLTAFAVEDATEVKESAKQLSDYLRCFLRTSENISDSRLKDYDGVDIKQTKDYIEMSCANYIRRILTSHGWNKDSSKSLPSKALSVPVSKSDATCTTKDASGVVASENVNSNSTVAGIINKKCTTGTGTSCFEWKVEVGTGTSCFECKVQVVFNKKVPEFSNKESLQHKSIWGPCMVFIHSFFTFGDQKGGVLYVFFDIIPCRLQPGTKMNYNFIILSLSQNPFCNPLLSKGLGGVL